MRSDDLLRLPDDLPEPVDDGAADHLVGAAFPAVALAATDGSTVRLHELDGLSVVFAYPRKGKPDEEPLGGAKRSSGCTCRIRCSATSGSSWRGRCGCRPSRSKVTRCTSG